jgi:dienelactone hydrolase
MHIEDIAYEASGIRMVGQLAYDDAVTGRRPAVLLSHEGPGLDDHVKGRAARLAALGYVAFALDYHGGGVPVPFDEMMTRLGALMADPAETRRRALAGLVVLLAQDQTDTDRVAAIGYCFGGTMSLEIACSDADVKAIVGFHPGISGGRVDDLRNISTPVLMCLGTEDPFVPLDQRLAWEKDMADAGVADWTLELYGGVGHSFTNPAAGDLGMPGIAFDEKADKRSWEAMLRLFHETIDA